MPADRAAPDVFSAREIARAAGVSVRQVRELIDSGAIDSTEARGLFMGPRDAVRAVRLLGGALAPGDLFRPGPAAGRSGGKALAASGALHATVLAGLILVTTMGLSSAPPARSAEPVRLVFLAIPGPGGGGGGGGLRQPLPPARAEMKGTSELRSPVPRPRPVIEKAQPQLRKIPPPIRPQPVEPSVQPPPVIVARAEPLPQVVAPVLTSATDMRDRAGALTQAATDLESSGPGAGGGAGTGQGIGIGEGSGSGIGPGSGGGSGGGPYRQGSGITAPSLLREVKPDYTEEARRRGIEGDVVLEIVVRADGGVTGVKVLQGLGAGLDQRAADAVRQWRFAPARRHGQAVDVVVEVAVAFKLR